MNHFRNRWPLAIAALGASILLVALPRLADERNVAPTGRGSIPPNATPGFKAASDTQAASSQGPGPSPTTGEEQETALEGCMGGTICDQETAILRSQASFPQGHDYKDWMAVPLTLDDAMRWRGSTLNDPGDPDATPNPLGLQPAWLVAARSETTTTSEFGMPSGVTPEPIAGFWAIWHAPLGSMSSMGGLEDAGGKLTYESIASLTPNPMPVYTVTPYPTITPGPSPTREPWD